MGGDRFIYMAEAAFVCSFTVSLIMFIWLMVDYEVDREGDRVFAVAMMMLSALMFFTLQLLLNIP